MASALFAVSATLPYSEKYPERVETLISALDLTYPGFEKALKAYESNNLDATIQQIIDYYREKPTPNKILLALPPARKDILELAEDVTRDIYTIQSKTYQQPRLADGSINWDDKGPNNDKEWAWMLNRHNHFKYLLTAYFATEQPKFIEVINEQLIDWIPKYPAPDRLTFSSSWRALEAARRVADSWSQTFYRLKHLDLLTDEAIFLILSAIPEHTHVLMNHYSFWGGNHQLTEKTAIAICAFAWPEFKKSQAWLEYAMLNTAEGLIEQTYPDGVYKELANHYQKVVAQNYQRLVELHSANDVEISDKRLYDRVEMMWDYFARISKPSGFGPKNNDSSQEHNFVFIDEIVDTYQRSDWEYILSYGQVGQPPAGFASKYYPWAGHAIMRNHWGEDALWSYFDIGPHGSAHQHNDKLHISLSVGPVDVLVDNGRYIYVPGPMRDYFRNISGHNTLKINGGEPLRPPHIVPEPLKNYHEINATYAAFRGRSTFPATRPLSNKITHERTLLFLKDSGWLVFDWVLTFGKTQIEANWNFHPDIEVNQIEEVLTADLAEYGTFQLSLLNPKKGNWDLAIGQTEPEVRGWHSWTYNQRQPAVSARYVDMLFSPRLYIWLLNPQNSENSTGLEATLINQKSGMAELLVTTASGEVFEIQYDALADKPVSVTQSSNTPFLAQSQSKPE